MHVGKLFCGGHSISYLTHPTKSGIPLPENVFGCRINLLEAHWHPVIELEDGHTKILWDVEIFDD